MFISIGCHYSINARPIAFYKCDIIEMDGPVFFSAAITEPRQKRKKCLKQKTTPNAPFWIWIWNASFSYRGSGINVDGDLMVLTELGFELRFAFAQCRGFNLYPVCKNNDWKLDRWIYWRDECYLINIWMQTADDSPWEIMNNCKINWNRKALVFYFENHTIAVVNSHLVKQSCVALSESINIILIASRLAKLTKNVISTIRTHSNKSDILVRSYGGMSVRVHSFPIVKSTYCIENGIGLGPFASTTK